MNQRQARKQESWEAAEKHLPALLTTGDVARVLARSADYVQKQARTGRLPHDRTEGGHRRFHVLDLIAYARERNLELFWKGGGNAPTTTAAQ